MACDSTSNDDLENVFKTHYTHCPVDAQHYDVHCYKNK